MNKQKQNLMIRIILTFMFLTFFCATSFAQETQTITANFIGIKSDKGKLFVALYNTKDSFLEKPFKTAIVAIKDLKSVAVFKDIPVGEYAISVFHDENDNKKMDTSFLGIPKEYIGTSNDAKGFMGPPKYKDAKFTLTKDENKCLTITIDSIF